MASPDGEPPGGGYFLYHARRSFAPRLSSLFRMRSRSLALLIALVLVSGLAGCGRLLGKRYDNFTAYYNTYYNAREAFERQEEDLLRAERRVERDRFLSLFVQPEASGSQGGGFEQAIEKGANLLRENPESKWVDDALLLIGKARFYQGDWAGAEEKFREVLGLGESKLDDEAWLWLGRALTAAERYDDAALTLRESLDRDGVDERWAAPMRLALAEVDVRRGDLDGAIVALEAGLESLRDKQLAARGAFLLGQVYDAVDRPADAVEAYGRVLSYGPRYELIYATQLSQALALGRSGESERALEILRRMRRDDKNFQNLAEVDLTRARVLAGAERPEEARDLLRDLLYDPDPDIQVSAVRGRVHYRLAEVYRDGLRDYIQAAAHYDTAATVLRQPADATIRYTREAIGDAPTRSSTFGSYARVSAEIAESDSLLYLGSLGEEEFAAAVETIRAERRAAAEAEARETRRLQAEQGCGETGRGLTSQRDRGDTAGDEGLVDSGAGFGFLSFRNAARVQDQLISFRARWSDRPLVPNWRRAAAIGGGVEVRQELAEETAGVPGIQTQDFTRDEFVDLSDIPRDPAAQREMVLKRAAARYELGNILFLSLSEPEAAAPWYRMVIEEGDAALVPRAYFALAETQLALGNEAEADDLYRQILERYPESTLATQVRERLGVAPVEKVVVPDSLAAADAAYALAYAQWQGGNYSEALDRMLTIGEEYPTTPTAARARLAAGALYAEWAAGDSVALLAPLPSLLDPPEQSSDVVTDGAPESPPDVSESIAVSVDSTDISVDSTDVAVVPPTDVGVEQPTAQTDEASPDSETLPDSSVSVPSTEVVYTDPWLYALYASIEEDYPGTSYAEQARAIRTALDDVYSIEARKAPAFEADSSASNDSLFVSETEGRVDLVTPGLSDIPGADYLFGQAPVRSEEGGFSWAVYTSTKRGDAVAVVLALADAGYRAALMTGLSGESARFSALAGQFWTEEEAQRARKGLPTLQSDEAPALTDLDAVTGSVEDQSALRRRLDQ